LDEYKHKPLVILVFFTAISQVKTIYKTPPKFTNKHISSTREEKKMKKEMKKNFDLRFSLML
jgi:hypothetical protein